MADTCRPYHDWFTASLTFGLCCGLLISYAPQHFRIINKKSSEGFSPWFLLLGSTSSAAGMFNMITMQWGIVKCCRVLSLGSCVEMTAGVVQVGIQWLMFTIVLVLYILYYPPHLKYVDTNVDSHDSRPPRLLKAPVRTENWRLSIILTWVTVSHLIFIAFATFYLLLTATPSPAPGIPLPEQVQNWATFLGVSSAMLAAIQYAPQLAHTYRLKLVGALSIPMMLIQSPGAALMVLSIALREGTNWTSWITFAVSGIMQGSLLIMCIMWKIRQGKLGIDDFGHPLGFEAVPQHHASYEDDIPGLVAGDEEPAAVQRALAAAIESAVEDDVRTANASPVDNEPAGEETPLLGPKASEGSQRRQGWFNWFGQ